MLHEYGETTDLAAARRIADAVCLRELWASCPAHARIRLLVADAKGKEYSQCTRLSWPFRRCAST